MKKRSQKVELLLPLKREKIGVQIISACSQDKSMSFQNNLPIYRSNVVGNPFIFNDRIQLFVKIKVKRISLKNDTKTTFLNLLANIRQLRCCTWIPPIDNARSNAAVQMLRSLLFGDIYQSTSQRFLFRSDCHFLSYF